MIVIDKKKLTYLMSLKAEIKFYKLLIFKLNKMNSIKKLFLIALSILILTSCAKIFYSVDAIPVAHSHKTIAIIPPTVSIAAGRKTDAEAIKEQQKTESLNFQKEMYVTSNGFMGGLGMFFAWQSTVYFTFDYLGV